MLRVRRSAAIDVMACTDGHTVPGGIVATPDSVERALQFHLAALWLDARERGGAVDFGFDDLAYVVFEPVRVPLMDRKRGIRKPAGMQAAISAARAMYTEPERTPLHDNTLDPNGFLRYKYQDREQSRTSENVALCVAFRAQLPLIWFRGVARGRYVAIRPVWIL